MGNNDANHYKTSCDACPTGQISDPRSVVYTLIDSTDIEGIRNKCAVVGCDNILSSPFTVNECGECEAGSGSSMDSFQDYRTIIDRSNIPVSGRNVGTVTYGDPLAVINDQPVYMQYVANGGSGETINILFATNTARSPSATPTRLQSGILDFVGYRPRDAQSGHKSTCTVRGFTVTGEFEPTPEYCTDVQVQNTCTDGDDTTANFCDVVWDEDLTSATINTQASLASANCTHTNTNTNTNKHTYERTYIHTHPSATNK